MKQLPKQPLVSIILPVHNAGRFLTETLKSIQKQTYTHFDVLCVDDNSTDNSYELLKKIVKKDTRFKVWKLKKNRGVSVAANEALKKAKGDFICRMDADDIMLPKRIAQQLHFLQTHPEIIAVGGQCMRIDERGKEQGIKAFPLKHAQLTSMVFRASPIQHPTLMVNRNKLPSDFPWYNPALKIGEDYDLYYKLLKYGKLANIPEIVLKYREHSKNLTLSSQKRTFWYITKSRAIAVFKYGYRPDFSSILNVFVQTVLVLLLPERILYPLHIHTRKLFF